MSIVQGRVCKPRNGGLPYDNTTNCRTCRAVRLRFHQGNQAKNARMPPLGSQVYIQLGGYAL